MFGTVRDMRYLDEPCYVYILVNPIDGKPFYIGISNNPWYRFYSHCHDYCSAARTALRSLLAGHYHRDEILKIYKKCPDRRTAYDLEYRLVTSTPNLLNKPYSNGRAY